MLELADLSLTVSINEYNEKMKKYQYKLVSLQQKIRTKNIPVMIMFEGWDASGKGGCIKRITEGMDPRGVRVWPIGAPNETERQYHYLWRFWKDIPAAGQIVIFDRSWYGRVLVERVEKLTPPKLWKMGYEEIRDFEQTLSESGMVIVKFWMQISKDEQLRRFKNRESDPLKQWKIGPDDWRNRDKWSEYEKAAEDMFKETHRPCAPWHIISAENKNYARLETCKILIEAIEEKLG
jgi:polyphosphate kinase 2 (PPK2 family)